MIRKLTARGFSLAEMMIVTMLMAVVMMGLVTLQDTMLRDRGKIIKDVAIRNQADYARRTIIRELSQATLVRSPDNWNDCPAGADCYSNELIGFENLDTTNLSRNAGQNCASNATCYFKDPNPSGSAHNVAADWLDLYGNPNALTSVFFRFCYDPSTKQLFSYIRKLNAGGALNAALTCMPPLAPSPSNCSTQPSPLNLNCSLGSSGANLTATDLMAGVPQGVITVETLDKSPNADPNWKNTWKNGVFHRTRKNTVEIGFSVQELVYNGFLSQVNSAKLASDVLTSVTFSSPNQ